MQTIEGNARTRFFGRGTGRSILKSRHVSMWCRKCIHTHRAVSVCFGCLSVTYSLCDMCLAAVVQHACAWSLDWHIVGSAASAAASSLHTQSSRHRYGPRRDRLCSIKNHEPDRCFWGGGGGFRSHTLRCELREWDVDGWHYCTMFDCLILFLRALEMPLEIVVVQNAHLP